MRSLWSSLSFSSVFTVCPGISKHLFSLKPNTLTCTVTSLTSKFVLGMTMRTVIGAAWLGTHIYPKETHQVFIWQIHMGYWPRLCGQDDWILTSFFMFMEQRRSQIFYWQAWSIKDVLHRKKLKHSLFSCGIQRVIPSRQDSSILLYLEHYSVPVNEN